MERSSESSGSRQLPRRRPLGFVRHAKDVCREARGQKAADVTSDVKYIRKSLCTSPNSVFQHQNVESSATLTSVQEGYGSPRPSAPPPLHIHQEFLCPCQVPTDCVPRRSRACGMQTVHNPLFLRKIVESLALPHKPNVRPVGTYETKMVARSSTGKRWMSTIGDCEQSTAHATSIGLRSLKELSHDCLVCLKP